MLANEIRVQSAASALAKSQQQMQSIQSPGIKTTNKQLKKSISPGLRNTYKRKVRKSGEVSTFQLNIQGTHDADPKPVDKPQANEKKEAGLQPVFENEFLTVSLVKRARDDDSGSEQSSSDEGSDYEVK